MAEDTVYFNGDPSNLLEAIADLVDGWEKLSRTQLKVVEKNVTLGESGELLAAKIKAVTSANQEVVFTIKDVEGALALANIQVKEHNNLVKEQAKQAKAAAKAERELQEAIDAQALKTKNARAATKIKRELQSGVDFSAATEKESAAVKNQIARIIEIGRAHGLTGSQVLAVWRDVASGTLKIYTGAYREVQDALIKYKNTRDAIGTELLAKEQKLTEQYKQEYAKREKIERDAIDSLRREAEASRSTAITDQSIPASGLKAATPDELFDLFDANRKVREFVKDNDISSQKVSQIWDDVTKGIIRDYEGVEAGVQKHLVNLHNAQQSLGNAARKDAAKRAAEDEKLREREAKAEAKRTKDFEAELAKRNKAAQKAAIEASRNREALEATAVVDADITPQRRDTATRDEFLNLHAANKALREFVKANNLTAALVAKIWKDVSHGIVNDYDGVRAGLQAKLVQVANAQAKLGSQVREDFVKLGEAAEKSNKKVLNVGITFSSLVKIFSIQILHQALSTVTNQMQTMTREALKLQEALGQVLTLSPPLESYKAWNATIRELSDSFGVDIVEQTKSAYNTLSNQVIETSAAYAEFGRVVNEFALATGSSSSDAANLIESVMNAYRKDVSEATDIAAELFRTIDLGRVSASDMANSLGSIIILAKEAGLTTAELNSMIATLTIQGYTYSEAATQIRGVLIKVLKPTEEMSKLFKELGVTSGEAAISLYGFPGLLKQIESRTKGSSTEMAEFVDAIRGLSGLLGVTGDNAEVYRSTLEKLKDPMVSYDRAVKLTTENIGFQFRKAANEIRNVFIEDLAGSFLKTIYDMSGGFDGLIEVFKNTAKVITALLIPAVAALTLVVGRLTVAALKNPFIALTVGATLLIVKLVELANASRVAFEEKMKADLDNYVKAQQRAIKELEKNLENYSNKIKAGITLQTAEYIKATAERLKILNSESSKVSEIYADIIERVKESQSAALASFKSTIEASKTSLNDYLKLFENIDKLIGKNAKDTDADLFDLGLENLAPEEQVNAIVDRINKLRVDASGLAATGDLDGYKAIRDEVQQLFDRRKSILAAIAEENGLNLDTNQLAKELVALRKQEREELEKIKQIKLEEAIAEQKANLERIAVEAKFESLTKKAGKFDVDTIAKAETEDVATKEFEKQKVVLTELAALQEKLGFKDAAAETRLQLHASEEVFVNRINTLRLEAVEKETAQRIALAKTEIETQERAVKTYSAEIDAVNKTIEDFRLQSEGSINPRNANVLANQDSLFSRLLLDADEKDVFARMQQLGQAASVNNQFNEALKNPQDSAALIEAINNLLARAKIDGPEEQQLADSLTGLRDALKEIESKGGFKDLINLRDQAAKQLEELSKKFAETTGADTGGVKTYTETLKSSSESLSTAINLLNKAVEAQTEELRRQNALPPAKGFAAGGFVPRGTDTVPAMLTPGEFVVNAAAAQRFRTQLVHMNSFKPQYLSSGGSVDVGGIHITLQSSGNAQVDATQLGNMLHREIRAGRLKPLTGV
jgi:TP901 family phage tail tape measure protein